LVTILVNSKPAVFVETHERRHAAHANLPTADGKTVAKLLVVLLLAESRDLLLLAICKCRPLLSCKLQPAHRSLH
jgi:hypothetical protein